MRPSAPASFARMASIVALSRRRMLSTVRPGWGVSVIFRSCPAGVRPRKASNRRRREGNQTWRQNSLRYSRPGRSEQGTGRNCVSGLRRKPTGVLYTKAASENTPRPFSPRADNRSAPAGVTFRGRISPCYDSVALPANCKDTEETHMLSRRKLFLLPVLLASVLGLAACPSQTNIGKITADPDRYMDKEVGIVGRVTDSYGVPLV